MVGFVDTNMMKLFPQCNDGPHKAFEMYAAIIYFYETQLANMQQVQRAHLPLFKPPQGMICHSTTNDDIESVMSNDISTDTTNSDTSSIDSVGGDHGNQDTYEAKMSE